jgi:hypothetical protein
MFSRKVRVKVKRLRLRAEVEGAGVMERVKYERNLN